MHSKISQKNKGAGVEKFLAKCLFFRLGKVISHWPFSLEENYMGPTGHLSFLSHLFRVRDGSTANTFISTGDVFYNSASFALPSVAHVEFLRPCPFVQK